jgi:hypothetical protein
MLVACWSVKGGVGTTTVAAGIAAAQAQVPGREVLVVDLGGDQPLLHGLAPTASAGLRGWTRAGGEVPPDALVRLEEPIDEHRRLLPAGIGDWALDRVPSLVASLALDERVVVADLGRLGGDPAGRALVGAAERSILVVRACPLSLRAVATLPEAPDAVIVVRDHRRALRWDEVADRCGAPVVAELDVDPMVGASVDAGLLARPFPRRFLGALAGIA